MTSQEYFDKHRQLEWLQGLARDYKKHIDLIEREENYFHVYGIQFAARGDTQIMNVNSNYFPRACIKQGLEVGLGTINVEIEDLKNELQSVTVTLE